MTDEERTAVRRARWRAVREGVGLVAIVLFVGGVYLGPLCLVLMRDVPQLAFVAPEPVRQVTILVGGLPDADDVLSDVGDGAEGDDDQGEVVVAAPEPTPPPALAEAEPVAPAAPVAKPIETPGRAEPKAESNPESKAEPKAEPTPEPEPVIEPEPAPTEVTPSTDATAAAEAAARRKGRRARCAEPNPDIRAVGEHHWEIERSLVTYYGSSVERFNSLGYSRHYEADDGTKGWLVGGFGCQSPLWKAGLHSQDVIRAINGKKTYNVLQLFGIWLTQKGKDEFVLDVIRKGKPLTLTYTLVGDKKRGRR